MKSLFVVTTSVVQPLKRLLQTISNEGLAMALPDRLFDAYIFDLDGTVYLGDALLPTAGETIATLRNSGKRTLFLSNNPTRTRQEYAAKLTRLGLPTAWKRTS